MPIRLSFSSMTLPMFGRDRSESPAFPESFLLIFGASMMSLNGEFYATPGLESNASVRPADIDSGRAASFCIVTGAVLE